MAVKDHEQMQPEDFEEAQIVDDENTNQFYEDKSEDVENSSEPDQSSNPVIAQENKQTSLQVRNNTEIAKLDTFSSVQDIVKFAKDIGIKGNPQQVAQIILRGKELGVPAMTAFDNIYIINGKATLSGHLVNALLTKAGIEFETICDNWYLGKDGSVSPVKITDPNPGVKAADSKIPNVSIDRICRIKFYKKSPWRKNKDGSPAVIEETVDYTWEEVKSAYLHDKDTWKAYGKKIFWLRTLVFGARRIAADVLLGMYEFSEIADANNVGYKLDESDMPIPIDITPR